MPATLVIDSTRMSVQGNRRIYQGTGTIDLYETGGLDIVPADVGFVHIERMDLTLIDNDSDYYILKYKPTSLIAGKLLIFKGPSDEGPLVELENGFPLTGFSFSWEATGR